MGCPGREQGGEVTEEMGGSMSRALCSGSLRPALSAVLSVHLCQRHRDSDTFRFPDAFSWHRKGDTSRVTEE